MRDESHTSANFEEAGKRSFNKAAYLPLLNQFYFGNEIIGIALPGH